MVLLNVFVDDQLLRQSQEDQRLQEQQVEHMMKVPFPTMHGVVLSVFDDDQLLRQSQEEQRLQQQQQAEHRMVEKVPFPARSFSEVFNKQGLIGSRH